MKLKECLETMFSRNDKVVICYRIGIEADTVENLLKNKTLVNNYKVKQVKDNRIFVK